MKKFFTLALALLLSVSMLVGCSGGSTTTATATPAEGTSGETGSEGGCPVTIGLVTDTGGVDDKSFNQSAWEGIQRFASDNGLDASCIDYIQSDSEADYVPNIQTMADKGFNLVVACGYLFKDAIDQVSAENPDTHFLFIDDESTNTAGNVMSAAFAAEQGSYLVGVAAGLTAKADGGNTVGFVGGMEGDLIGAFQAGYEQGVLEVCPECTIYVDYADSFSDDAKGQSLAVKQYDAGATVIYQAAGAAGNGVIKEAKERGNVWAIGVDKDQYEDGMKDDGTSIILTSMVKRVDNATYQASQAIKDGTFQDGLVTFTLENEGVGAEVTTGRNLSDDILTQIADYASKIQSGEITVSAKPTIANGATN